MPSTDRDLIAAYLSGHPASVRTVDRWIGSALWSFRARLGDGVEDVAQDVRLELVRRFQAGEFHGDAGLKTYVWRVSSHAAITRVRREDVRRTEPLDVEAAVSVTDPSALDVVLHAEAQAVARRTLARAAPLCRQLWIRLIAGHTYAEISRDLGMSEGALRVRALRCRRAAARGRNAGRLPDAETNLHLERQS